MSLKPRESQVRWHMPVIPVTQQVEAEDCELKVRLRNFVRSCPRIKDEKAQEYSSVVKHSLVKPLTHTHKEREKERRKEGRVERGREPREHSCRNEQPRESDAVSHRWPKRPRQPTQLTCPSPVLPSAPSCILMEWPSVCLSSKATCALWGFMS